MFLSSMDKRYTLLATSGKILVEMKKAEPCSIGFWKRKFNFTVGKKHMVVELQMYPGDKTPNTSVEDIAQYLRYKYTPFQRWKWGITTNDQIVLISQHLFAECALVLEFWKFIEGIILREFGLKIKLHCTDIMLEYSGLPCRHITLKTTTTTKNLSF